MIINGINIEMSKEDRHIVKEFFHKNIVFLINNNISIYENLKTFGDLCQKYINDNNLKNNNGMMLLLYIIRQDENLLLNGYKLEIKKEINESAHDHYDFITIPSIREFFLESIKQEPKKITKGI